ncbi:MAG TPA: hypothetical protein DGT23_11970 [Micromonosporaceae bacterium]|nr:hypothetical protein [Micromonosporaceae bacterium]
MQEIHRRLGLPEIPQELIDKARRQLEEHEERLRDPELQAARRAHCEALLAQFRRPPLTLDEAIAAVVARLRQPD